MVVLRNQKQWLKYKNKQENRVYPNPFNHVGFPKEFPVLVFSSIRNDGSFFSLIHTCVYKKDVLPLIKSNKKIK